MAKLIPATLAALILAGCAVSPYDFPVPTMLPDGKRGFGMTGYVSYTSDEAKARREIEQTFERACNGPVIIRDLEIARADSLGGIPHFRYNAVAECR